MPKFVNEQLQHQHQHQQLTATSMWTCDWYIESQKVNCLHLTYCCVHCCVNNSYESKIINAFTYCAIIHFKLSAFACNALGIVYWKNFALPNFAFFVLSQKCCYATLVTYKNIFMKHLKLAFSRKFSNATLLIQ